MPYILKAGNTILKTTANKVFRVGGMAPPVLDLDPAAITGVVNNSPISIFPDTSGNGNNAIQGSATLQPKYFTNQLNGYPAIGSDGIDDFMQLLIAVPAKTIFLVIRDNGSAAYGTVFSGPSGQGLNYLGGSSAYFTDGTEVGGSFGSNPYNKIYANGGLAPTTKSVVRSSAYAILTLDVTDSRPISHLFASSRANPATDWGKWLIARLRIYDYRLTELDRKAVETQLKTQYGL